MGDARTGGAVKGEQDPLDPTPALMTEIRGASNVKAKGELGWQPRHPSWRQGLAT
jgi:hypothetical protein